MPPVLSIVWVVGFALLGAWVVRAVRRARRPDADPVPRAEVLGAAALVLALAGVAAALGIGVARIGRTRIGAASAGEAAAAPARARLLVRWVQLQLERSATPADAGNPFEAALGYTPDAALRLPRGYGLAEAQRGWDLVRLRAIGASGLRAEIIAPPEATTTRVLLAAAPADGASPRERLARAVASLVEARGRRCKAPPAAAAEAPGSLAIVLCAGDEPRAALLVERDLPWRDAQAARVPLRVAPFLFQDGAWRDHSLQIAPGTLVQMGAVADAVPGVVLWELPAPPGRTELFFPPRDLLLPCAAWTRGAGGGFLGADPAAATRAESPDADEDASACVLPFSPPFGLEVRRLVPAQAVLAARSLFFAALFAAPALLALALLGTRPRSELDPGRFARLGGLGWAGAFLGGLSVFRLLFAHRLDVLRHFEAVGPLVLQNQSFVALGAATLAAAAVFAWHGPARPGNRSRRVLLQALGAWALFAGAGLLALVGDAHAPTGAEEGSKLFLEILLSAALGAVPWWWEALRARLAPAGTPTGLSCLLLGVGLCAALGSRRLGVLPKLACAWAFVFLLYAGLRASIGSARARRHVVGAALLAAAALLYGDPGVALAIGGPGVLGALLLLSHDVSYREDQARTLDGYAGHAPLVRLHAAFALLGGLALAIGAALALGHSLRHGEPDGTPARAFTLGALHLPLVAAALVGIVGGCALRRGQRGRAARWLALAAALTAVWALRAPLLDRVLATQTRAAQRLALVLDPAYALLSSERDFQRGLAAWNETRLPGAGATPLDGQGYFGSQIADPGVRRSLDNDYLPVLALRELGLRGLGTLLVAYLALLGFAVVLASERFRDGSAAQRARLLAALVLGALAVYQPLASLGALPLTGIAWPGLGLNSPTDFWLLLALLLGFTCWGPAPVSEVAEEKRLESFDRELRAIGAHRRTRRLAMAAVVVVGVGAALCVVRGGAFALRRPAPLFAGKAGRERLVAPFESLSDAVDYVSRLQCDARAGELVPSEIRGDPAAAPGLRRFHAAFSQAFGAARARALGIVRGFVETGRCGPVAGAVGAFSAELSPDGDECRLGFKFGWPEVRLVVARRGDRVAAECQVDARPEPLRALRPRARPAEAERIRLVSSPHGAAASDLGELLAGDVVVRLRPAPAGARRPPAPLAAPTLLPGVYFASEVRLSDDLSLATGGGAVRLVRRGGARPAREPAWLVVRQAPAERLAETDEGGWSVHALGERDEAIPLGSLALVVTGRARGRTVWLFRPAVARSGSPRPTADPLLADDVATASGRRWRHYVYGGRVPELGWVNPYESRLSLGLDGWVHVAVSDHERESALAALPADGSQAPHGPAAAVRDFTAGACGTLHPFAEPPIDPYPSVCAPSPLDGVLECRVSLQPELETRLRHLLELASLSPELFPRPQSGRRARPAQRADFTLLSGETGEILARGDFVPGRESTVYAPGTPEIEQALVRLREGREPGSGRKLGHAAEPGALKADWSARVAIGSTLKPLFAQALERADPALAHRLHLGAPAAPSAGECPGGWPPLLGHCPPTRSLWEEGQPDADFTRYLAESLNWFQAAVALLGPAAGGGSIGFGVEGVPAPTDGLESLRLDDSSRAQALFARSPSGKLVVSPDSMLDLEALRETPFWRELEAIVGRPLCTGPGKRACEQQSERGDLCAARALPIRRPSRDLKHLVATGPSDFDFLPPRASGRVQLTEYFQFVRGSGVHELGSLLQLADAFNRLFFERTPSAGSAYRLAASWFPVARTGSLPAWSCSEPESLLGVARGLCDAISAPYGTARGLAPLLHEDGLVIYGAKTGTIDALRDVAEGRSACESYNRARTVPGLARQPYHLPCGRGNREDINDSLLVVAFGVREAGHMVPLTLALRFSGTGQGYATVVARSFIDAIRDDFGAAAAPSTMASKR